MSVLGYRPDIDGLRAFAVVSVLIYHAYPEFLAGGYIGVDIFFVISGFLITSILIKESQSDSFSFSSFYARRLRRLAPALLVVLVFLFIAGWFCLTATEYSLVGRNAAASLLFVVNFLYANGDGYFDDEAELNPLLHLWSLAVEEQFYFIWPSLFIIFYGALSQRAAFVVIGGGVAAAFLLAVTWSFFAPEASFFVSPSRMWELALGGFIALPLVNKRAAEVGSYLRSWVSVIALLVLVLSVCFIKGQRINQPTWLLLPVLATAVLISCGSNAFVNKNILSVRVLVFVGLISYPLYLWHWPLLSMLNITEGGAHSNWLRLLAITISGILAYLTWRFVEEPVRRTRTRFMLVCLFASVVTLTLVACLIVICQGFPSRISDDVSEDAVRLEWPLSYRSTDACQKDVGIEGLSFCLRSNVSVDTDHAAALIGDSFSNQYFYGLAPKLSENGVGLMNLGRHSCAPVRGVQRYRKDKDCSAVEKIIDAVKADERILTVFLAASWSGTDAYLNNGDVGSFSRQLNTTVEEFLEAGKKVILVGSTPLHLMNPMVCVERPVRLGEYDALCSIERQVIDGRLSREYEMLRSITTKHLGVGYFNPVQYLCSEVACPMRGSTGLFYRDGHLSDRGSEYLAGFMGSFYVDFIRPPSKESF